MTAAGVDKGPNGKGERLAPLMATLRPLFPEELWPGIWLTGGTVRDTLLGRGGKDIDLTAAIPPELLRKLGFRLVTGRSTAPVWLRHDDAIGSVEITRLDSVAGLPDDLRRRDFTINAIAVSLQGEVTDPLCGRSHVEEGLLEPCSTEIFSADPLRVFRAFRFAAEGFSLSTTTEMLLARGWDDTLTRIPVERFSREMLKALAAPMPELFFRLMIRFGIGRVFLPELFHMATVPAGPPEHHPEGDLLSHSLQVLQQVARKTDNPLARFCALFHDIGKLATEPACYPRHHGHEEAGFNTAGVFCHRLRLSLEHGRALAWVSRLHGKANRLATLRPATGIGLAEQALKGGVDKILPLVSAADCPGGMEPELWRQLTLAAGMTTRQLGIEQERLLLVPAGKRGDLILQRKIEMVRNFS